MQPKPMEDNKDRTQFILYLCPTGPLGAALDSFFKRTAKEFGPNAAHAYMPHCTLTGFFWDEPSHAAQYIEALNACVQHCEWLKEEKEPIKITQLVTKPKWIGLEIDAPLIKRWVTQFVERAETPGLREHIRMKQWLHLSFAYGYPAEQFEPLAAMGRQIDLSQTVSWELRFYDRSQAQEWTLHWKTEI